ncbi:MAG TPA: hypothetical protein VFS47_11715 [Steroidobacteraceae bacterium]|nr:hypothetical protein [Steroidobacteraceae bacterium]
MNTWTRYLALISSSIATVFVVSNAHSQDVSALGLLDTVEHAYHGVAVNRDMKPVSIDSTALDQTYSTFLKTFAKQRDPADVEQWKALRAGLKEQGISNGYIDLSLKGIEAEMLFEQIKELSKQPYAWKFNYLREAAKEKAGEKRDADQEKRLVVYISQLKYFPWREDLLRRIREWLGQILFENQYTRDCRAQHVPIPPDWNSGSWSLRGTVPTSRLFLNLGNPVEVWTVGDSTTDGGCIALPRWGSGSVTLGVICQSASTGKACFWDNRPHEGGPTFSPAELSTKSITRDWVNGYDAALVGGGKCTMCHRGDNVFALHSDGALSRSVPFNAQASIRYQPLTNLGWFNPPATSLPSGGCTSCHGIGDTTDAEKASYCSILRKAATNEMPNVFSPAGWTSPSSSFAVHINALKANCGP